MLPWVHAAFVGTLVGLVVLLTAVEVLNLRHTKRCLEDGYEGVRSFSDEESRYRYLRGEAAGRTLNRVLLVTFVLGLVYLGPLEWLVDELAGRADPQWWVAAGLAIVVGEVVFEELGSLVRLRLGFEDTGLLAVLSYWVANRLTDALWGVAVSGSLIVVATVIVVHWPERWPLYVLVAFVLVKLLVNLLLPLYQRQLWEDEAEPVPRGAVSDVLSRFDVSPAIVDVESTDEDVVEASELAGLGPSRTVFIREHDGTFSEFKATLAHELGHAEHSHVEKLVAYNVGVVGIDVLLVWTLLDSPWFYAAFGIPQGVTVPAVLVALIWVAAVHRLVFSTFENWMAHRYEYVADSYAFEQGYPGIWEGSLRDHCDSTLVNPYQHPLFSLLNTVHPPVVARIERGEDG